MLSISSYQYDIQRYRSLKAEVKLVISNLTSALDNIDTIKNGVKDKYQIDNNFTPIVSRTANLDDKMRKTLQFLEKEVVPSIDASIANLYKKIANLEANNRT